MPFDPLQIVGNTPGSQLSACTHTTAHTARPHIVHMIPASAESGIRTRKRHNFRTQPESEDSQRIERSRMKNAQMLRLLHPLLYNESLRIIISRSEEHTSELQSRGHLVCRLLLE